MKRAPLNFEGTLKYRDSRKTASWEDAVSVPAHIPGNVEIDLMEAGILPDLYFGDNILLLKPYERYDWKYELTFKAQRPTEGETAYLCFGGVDCFADYYLNGSYLGHSENALIEHRFLVTEQLLNGENRLEVELRSPICEAEKQAHDIGGEHAMETNYESLWVRKAPASYGWDIAPRLLSAGIWRDVFLEIEGENEILSVYLATEDANRYFAFLHMNYALKTNVDPREELILQVEGCSVSGKRFSKTQRVGFPTGHLRIGVSDPDLWWPYGYGEPAMYNVEVKLLHKDRVLAQKSLRFGIRKVKLNRSDLMDPCTGGEFAFVINGERIMCKGSNWVPADALHSRDASRYERMLSMFTDTECNIIRCWGGNVYEDHAFFDYCDSHGLMVWQDFAMACGKYPSDAAFLDSMRREAESVVKKLRNHPSLVLWSGDNECDIFILMHGGCDPNENKLTRQVLPDVIERLDPFRDFLPSSPYISKAAFEKLRKAGSTDWYGVLPEDHLWGPRDYYKTPYYGDIRQRFVSEMGYHGCNSQSSIRSFIAPDKLWSYENNDQWLVHASEMNGPTGPFSYRIGLMARQTKQLFGYIADNLPEFVLMSQISQAEAFKFFIESTRRAKWERSGVIWWNMIDCWPQFSDAVVSYDFIKKLAYYYIKQSQQTVALVLGELGGWSCPVIACNDTLQDAKGSYKVYDGESGETLSEGAFFAPANSTAQLCRFEAFFSDRRLIVLEWEIDGVKHYNHGVLGSPAFSLPQYRKWLQVLGTLYGFDIDCVIG